MSKYKKYNVFYDSPGQMCNRFWSYIDSVAWAIENKGKIFVLFWDKSIKDFDKLRHNPYLAFPFYSIRMIRLVGEERYIQMLKRLFTNRYSRFIYRNFLKHFVSALRSYDIHNEHKYYPRYIEEIREIFMPNKDQRNDVDSLVEKLHIDGYTVVGIHVRRGDYQNWRGGVFFFAYDEYLAFMRQVRDALKGRKTIFYISTNEQCRDWIQQSDLSICDFRGKSAAMDIYALSQCDLILGPPSSFSRWASLMGHVPIYQIWDKKEKITASSFSPLRYLDEREDGLKYK